MKRLFDIFAQSIKPANLPVFILRTVHRLENREFLFILLNGFQNIQAIVNELFQCSCIAIKCETEILFGVFHHSWLDEA